MSKQLTSENYDVMVLYGKRDYEEAKKYCEHLKSLQIEDRKPVKAIMHNGIERLKDTITCCTYVFIFLTKNFCSIDWHQLSAQECINECIFQEKWRLVPVHTKDPDKNLFNIPMGLKTLKSLNYFRCDDYYFRDVKALICRRRKQNEENSIPEEHDNDVSRIVEKEHEKIRKDVSGYEHQKSYNPGCNTRPFRSFQSQKSWPSSPLNFPSDIQDKKSETDYSMASFLPSGHRTVSNTPGSLEIPVVIDDSCSKKFPHIDISADSRIRLYDQKEMTQNTVKAGKQSNVKFQKTHFINQPDQAVTSSDPQCLSDEGSLEEDTSPETFINNFDDDGPDRKEETQSNQNTTGLNEKYDCDPNISDENKTANGQHEVKMIENHYHYHNTTKEVVNIVNAENVVVGRKGEIHINADDIETKHLAKGGEDIDKTSQ